MEFQEPRVVAEIGCNHLGKMDVAKEMLQTLKHFCKVKYAKFQKRTIKELLTEEEYNSPHPVPQNSYGESYGKHREALEFTIDQHKELKELCEELGIVYISSVWDLTAAREVSSLNPEIIKVPSACSTYWDLHNLLIDSFRGEIHISVGMTTPEEIESIVSFYEKHSRNQDLVLYHCISGYPIPFEDTVLLEIDRLKNLYGEKVKSIGFSGHHRGIAIDIAAYTLGAQWIERHFTLDRTQKGTDHAASLEPDGLRKLQRDLLATYSSLHYKNKKLLDIEIPQAKKLRWDRHSFTEND
jgi:N-acetylneuraminate synthase